MRADFSLPGLESWHTHLRFVIVIEADLPIKGATEAPPERQSLLHHEAIWF